MTLQSFLKKKKNSKLNTMSKSFLFNDFLSEIKQVLQYSYNHVSIKKYCLYTVNNVKFINNKKNIY